VRLFGFGRQKQIGFITIYCSLEHHQKLSMLLSLLTESGPQFKTLKVNQSKLSDAERVKVMSAKAVWNFGSDGKSSPAIKKAVVKGKTYYWSNTHRCYQCSTTLDQAIKQFFDAVKPSS
jgi:hypothetical protein